jgi:hypothetical protein
MSRSRSLIINGEKEWFQTTSAKATDRQLELLASVEDVDLDELLESSITQAEVLRRLREALGQGAIPHEVLVRRQKFRRARQAQPGCRLCGKAGDSTRHHFVNKWILRELEHYQARWADRRENCIPVCIDCHRDLHDRSNPSVSIADRLTDREKAFANRALEALAEERPRLLILIARGDVYESRLVKDWFDGKLNVSAEVEAPLGRAA